jgi:hypothetical protein
MFLRCASGSPQSSPPLADFSTTCKLQHNRLDLSEVVYRAVDKVDTTAQNKSFRAFSDLMNDNLPECQIIAVSSRMTMEVVAPVKTLLEPGSTIPTINKMGVNPQDLLHAGDTEPELSLLDLALEILDER